MRLARLAALAVLTPSLVVAGAATTDVSAQAETPTPPFITDARGRALILHGLNTAGSAKGASGLPWITREDVAHEARDLGTNVVRYLVQWKNIEPKPGHYDDDYLDAVAERVGWYHDYGISVVLDMHQDLYGPTACGEDTGNGAPAWATHTDGRFCTPISPWSAIYLEPGVTRAFDNFWNTTGEHPELIRRYAAMFRHVAARFANVPGVLGYDLMNEPWGGSRQGKAFEEAILTPFYQRVTDAIRTVDPKHWIFVEPQANGVNWGEKSYLGHISDPRPGRPRIVYAPHFYPPTMDIGGGYTGLNKILVQWQMAHWRDNTLATAKRLGAPVLLGEFEISESGNVTGGFDYVDDVLALANKLKAGWAFWSNDPGGVVDGDHHWNPIAKRLTVAYPRAVAGTPTKISYDRDRRRLTVGWHDRAGVSGPTEIWLPPTAFPNGPKVTVSDPASTWKARWDATSHLLRIWTRHDDASAHTVTVTPAG